MRIKRVFLLVMDSFGMGALPDAAAYGDEGSDTLKSVCSSSFFNAPALTRLGLFNIDGAPGGRAVRSPEASFARLAERSAGKDTTIGHWEIAGVVSPKPLPTYENGFPSELIKRYEALTGHEVLCNRPYSGTEVIRDYGREQIEKNALIVYTSADSVFQVAAHERFTGLDELYRCCAIARELMSGDHGVGRVIARPFDGDYPDFYRTKNRHDYSLEPPKDTMLDILSGAGRDVIGVGKIYDIFARRGITASERSSGNGDGMDKTMEIAGKDFNGLCFVNLVDFDMLYGHRNDADGYARAASNFDGRLDGLLKVMRPGDALIISADHGCDPATLSTDHSREYVPALFWGKGVKKGVNLGTRPTFADIAATVLEMLGVEGKTDGTGFFAQIEEDMI